MDKLFTSYRLGDITLNNRVVMAPMTRSRARAGDTADEMTAQYYQQRATAGLIITEGSQISVQGQGYLFTPGIYNDEQVTGWGKTTRAVHAAGGGRQDLPAALARWPHLSYQPAARWPATRQRCRRQGRKFNLLRSQ
jgi:hypothetical protein